MIGSTARFVAQGLATAAPRRLPGLLAQAFPSAPKASSSAMFSGLASGAAGVKDTKASAKDHTVIVKREDVSYRPSNVSLLKGIVGGTPGYVPGMDDLLKISEAAFTRIEEMEPFSDEQAEGINARARVRELQGLKETMEPEAFGALLRKEARELFETLAGPVADGKQVSSSVYYQAIDGSKNTLPVAWEPPGPALKLKDGSEMGSRKAAGFDAGAVAMFLQGLDGESFSSRFPAFGLKTDSTVQNFGHELVARSGVGGRDLILAENDKREVTGFADLARVNVDQLGQHFASHDKTGVVRNVPTCEVSVLVGDESQGKGLGRALLAQALKTARDDGFEQVTAVVSEDNTGMLKLLKQAGIETHVPAATGGYLHFVADLAKLA